MEQLETLNAIAEEFSVKTATLQAFKLEQLYLEGKKYSVLTNPPRHLETGYIPQIMFEDKDQSFCSIFSDPATTDMSNSTQVTDCIPSIKLVSQPDILSSDFDADQVATILTSDVC